MEFSFGHDVGYKWVLSDWPLTYIAATYFHPSIQKRWSPQKSKPIHNSFDYLFNLEASSHERYQANWLGDLRLITTQNLGRIVSVLDLRQQTILWWKEWTIIQKNSISTAIPLSQTIISFQTGQTGTHWVSLRFKVINLPQIFVAFVNNPIPKSTCNFIVI